MRWCDSVAGWPGNRRPADLGKEENAKMQLKERLGTDMRAALKAREAGKKRLWVLRMALSAIKNAEIAKRTVLNDDGVLEVLAAEMRTRRETAAEFRRLGREDAAVEAEGEAAILSEYLPPPLGEDELRRMVAAAVAETGASLLRDLGKVMGKLMPQVRGRADGTLVQQLTRETLEKGTG